MLDRLVGEAHTVLEIQVVAVDNIIAFANFIETRAP